MTTCSNCEKTVGNGEKCERCQNSANNDTTRSTKYIRNELLTYAFHHTQNSTIEALCSAISGFYRPEEVLEARECLNKAYGDTDLLHGDLRKTPRNTARLEGTALNRMVEDIVTKGIRPIVNAETTTDTTFVAVDIGRIPQYSPEQINLQAVLVRLAALEATVKRNTEHIADNTIRINGVDRQKAAGNDLYPGGARPRTPYRANPPPSVPLRTTHDLREESKGAEAMDIAKSWSDVVIPAPSNMHMASEKHRAETGIMVASASKDDNIGWRIQREEKKRLLRQANDKIRTVTGKRNNPNFKIALNVRSIYVYNVNEDYVERDIENMIKDNDMEVKFIKMINDGKYNMKKSFLVKVLEEDFEKTMTDDFWPERVKCREWLTSNRLKELCNTL